MREPWEHELKEEFHLVQNTKSVIPSL